MAVMKKIKKLCYLQWTVLCTAVLLIPLACSKNHGNTANDLLEIINTNRTSHKLHELSASPGLGCIALQYAESCSQNCTSNNTIHCQPPEDDFTEVFAPNCGVELPTFGAISGHILGCHRKHMHPQEAFLNAIAGDQKAFRLVRNGSFVQAGVGVVRKGGYVWCVVFSESPRNGSFVLADLGKGIEQKRGCYSGVDMHCSGGDKQKSEVHMAMALVYVFLVSSVVLMG